MSVWGNSQKTRADPLIPKASPLLRPSLGLGHNVRPLIPNSPYRTDAVFATSMLAKTSSSKGE